MEFLPIDPGISPSTSLGTCLGWNGCLGEEPGDSIGGTWVGNEGSMAGLRLDQRYHFLVLLDITIVTMTSYYPGTTVIMHITYRIIYIYI